MHEGCDIHYLRGGSVNECKTQEYIQDQQLKGGENQQCRVDTHIQRSVSTLLASFLHRDVCFQTKNEPAAHSHLADSTID